MAIENFRLNLAGRICKICHSMYQVSFRNNICQHKKDDAIGSTVNPVLPETFVAHLEKALMPEQEKFTKPIPWESYADDTITYIKPDDFADVISILNKFLENIKFTWEVEHTHKYHC